MTQENLTYEQALRLQRYVDRELPAEERAAIEEALATRPGWQIYVAALQELKLAVEMAAEAAWERAPAVDAATIARLAQAASDLSESSLDELAPMLERFHDGEVDEAEGAVIAALLETREDVADYLAELDAMSQSIRGSDLSAGADFDDFWQKIEAGIDQADHASSDAPVAELRPAIPFDDDEHRVLLYRYHDGEVSAEERTLVERWIAAGEPQVDATLGALAELHVGLNAGVELAQDSADFAELWEGIAAGIDRADAEEAAGNVVTLQDRKSDKAAAPRSIVHSPVFALAAAVALLICGAIVSQTFMQQEKIVETRTVVIFDSVEYAPGSSVMIHTPQLAGLSAEEAAEEVPILWVMEDEDPATPSADEHEASPAEDPVEDPDAGDVEVEEQPPGLPI
ncbi:hypothetical protein FRC98_17340 [Lujinxingia vulgaris]|uniref:Uncharacterized protein n=1 Tax=Lujinxingia vulgaris TaxID=2600176 RepID=A0A5C6XDR4_9DELT|nr:hypothetical protein [Lujinxingia vulgaris]TXD35230.1 hypothetical protein FRC98_17340 [Lujinxingia vulgaris]